MEAVKDLVFGGVVFSDAAFGRGDDAVGRIHGGHRGENPGESSCRDRTEHGGPEQNGFRLFRQHDLAPGNISMFT